MAHLNAVDDQLLDKETWTHYTGDNIIEAKLIQSKAAPINALIDLLKEFVSVHNQALKEHLMGNEIENEKKTDWVRFFTCSSFLRLPSGMIKV